MDRIQKIEEMLVQSPADPFLRHALALEFVKKGDDEKARRLFEKVLDDNPDYVGSYYHLARVLERLGLKEEALTYYQRGMSVAKEKGETHTYNELYAAYEDLLDS